MPSEEVKYEECEKMSLDSEEGAISGKATMPRVSNWRVPMRASGCNDPGRVFVFWCKLTTGSRCSSVLELGGEGAAGREGLRRLGETLFHLRCETSFRLGACAYSRIRVRTRGSLRACMNENEIR